MTPATVLHVFRDAGVPIVRYAQSPQLCDAHSCTGLDYAGSGIRAYLAPREHPTFEVVVFKTPGDARQIAHLTGAARRGNAILFQKRASVNIRRIFERILP